MMDRFYRFGQSLDAPQESTKELDDDSRIILAALEIAFFERPSAETTLLETALSAADEKQRRSYAESYLKGIRNPDSSVFVYSDRPDPSIIESTKKLDSKVLSPGGLSESEQASIRRQVEVGDFATKTLYFGLLIRNTFQSHDGLAELQQLATSIRHDAKVPRERDYWELMGNLLEFVELQGFPKKDNEETLSAPITEREKCRGNMLSIAAAEMVHRVRTRSTYTADLNELKKAFDGAPFPMCPARGKYSVEVDVPKGSFTVHCSVLKHDRGNRGEPQGYSPDLNDEPN